MIEQYPALQVEMMQDWVGQHPEGTPITVHYDPANPKKAALVMTDMPFSGPRTPDNLKLLGFFAVSSLVMLGIGRVAWLRSATANGRG